MRRKPGSILPIEETLLAAGLDLQRRDEAGFHGFLVAKHMEEIGEAKLLIAHGTLYKALNRMETAGLVESRWEDPELALDEGRPRRKLYRVTGAGEAALSAARSGRRQLRADGGMAPA